mmetsp:Transcript_4304/g.11268  ORF Transcript_4304/g.11268 Transcript_4304/m.11268 type:complete len:209 (+) Transcript_4304:156-782(+)
MERRPVCDGPTGEACISIHPSIHPIMQTSTYPLGQSVHSLTHSLTQPPGHSTPLHSLQPALSHLTAAFANADSPVAVLVQLVVLLVVAVGDVGQHVGRAGAELALEEGRKEDQQGKQHAGEQRRPQHLVSTTVRLPLLDLVLVLVGHTAASALAIARHAPPLMQTAPSRIAHHLRMGREVDAVIVGAGGGDGRGGEVAGKVHRVGMGV